MKKIPKILLSLTLLFSPITLKAAFIESFNTFDSSYTVTNETTKLIFNTPPGTVLAQINVSSVSTGGLLQVYDSSDTATNKIANVTLATVGSYRYEVRLSSGLTYTTTGNGAGVTIIYKRIR